jgi:ADP-ribosylglycohydrolase
MMNEAYARRTRRGKWTCGSVQRLLTGGVIRRWGRRYRNAGYGRAFRTWLDTDNTPPYNSFGNGSAMRVSPVAYTRDSVDAVLAEAERSASVTHNHPEGVKGAQAAALAVYLARTGVRKPVIRDELTSRFGYDLGRTIEEIRPTYAFDVTCQGSVPEALIVFLDTPDVVTAVRTAVSLGGDADTQAAIAGAAAYAVNGELPDDIQTEVRKRLPDEMLEVLDAFDARYGR